MRSKPEFRRFCTNCDSEAEPSATACDSCNGVTFARYRMVSDTVTNAAPPAPTSAPVSDQKNY